MTSELELLLNKMKALESELVEELQKQQETFSYEIRKRKVYFEASAIIRHQAHIKSLYFYFKDAPLKHILSAPIIWMCIVPALLMDTTCSLYQWVCFPVYGIPRVQRQDYFIFDREYLGYLNIIEKINCAYCSYFNGLMAYLQEIAGRTEQFWCPIKHAGRLKNLHSRYHKFITYGDASQYRSEVQITRHDFKDLE